MRRNRRRRSRKNLSKLRWISRNQSPPRWQPPRARRSAARRNQRTTVPRRPQNQQRRAAPRRPQYQRRRAALRTRHPLRPRLLNCRPPGHCRRQTLARPSRANKARLRLRHPSPSVRQLRFRHPCRHPSLRQNHRRVRLLRRSSPRRRHLRQARRRSHRRRATLLPRRRHVHRSRPLLGRWNGA